MLVVGHWIQATIQPIGFVIGSRGKEERIDGLPLVPIPEGDAPKTVDRERLAVHILQLAPGIAAREIERVDATVAEIADEQVAAELAESRGRERKAPGRIEVAL